MTTTHLRSGSLDRYVSIQRRSIAQDTFGGQLETWTEIKKVYASIEALSGNERLAAQSLSTDISHRITVRYDAIFADPKVAATYRVVYLGRIFDVQACLNVDEGNWIVELMAAEGMTLG